jgi:hypothetical protein
MNCPECQDRLQARLDGAGGPPSADLDRHLAQCPECRARFAAAGRLLDGLRSRPRIQPPADFARRAVAGVLEDRARRRALARRRLFVTCTLAASIVVLLLIGYFRMPGDVPHGVEPKQPVAENKKSPAPPPAPEPRESPEPALRPEEVRVAVAGATEKLADRAFEQMRMFVSAATPPGLPPAALPTMPEPFDAEAAQSLRDAGQEVQDGLQTVTRTARRAFDYFSRDLPMFDLPREN